MYHRRIFQVCRSISLLIALIASGCQTASHRPDFLASDAASFITCVTIDVNGGL